jgi:hypothetical protein
MSKIINEIIVPTLKNSKDRERARYWGEIRRSIQDHMNPSIPGWLDSEVKKMGSDKWLSLYKDIAFLPPLPQPKKKNQSRKQISKESTILKIKRPRKTPPKIKVVSGGLPGLGKKP